MDSAKYDTQLSFVYIVSRVRGQILEYSLLFLFSFHLTWQGITFVRMRRNISGSTLKFISCFVWKFHFPSIGYEHNLVTFLERNLKNQHYEMQEVDKRRHIQKFLFLFRFW